MQSNTLTKIPTAQEFLDSFRGAVGNVVLEFANKYDDIVALNPRFPKELREAGASTHFIRCLAKYGRGELNPALLNEPGVPYQLLATLVREEQDRLLEEGVPVLEIKPDGTVDERVIPVADLTPAQARQAIGKTPAQQRTWLNEHAPKVKSVSADLRVFKTQGYAIYQGVKITKKLILQILQEMD